MPERIDVNFYEHKPSFFEVGARISTFPMVYVIVTNDFKFMKIGSTKAFKQRLSNIQSGCPFKLSLWLGIRTPVHKAVEKDLQKKMAHVRRNGEWFAPFDSDIDAISRYCTDTNKHIRKVVNALL